eukprot:jgi/Bigna1/91345/estExt_fgenesh1_pg.C_970045
MPSLNIFVGLLHQSGNMLLKKMERLLPQSFARSRNIVSHFFGEEVLIPLLIHILSHPKSNTEVGAQANLLSLIWINHLIIFLAWCCSTECKKQILILFLGGNFDATISQGHGPISNILYLTILDLKADFHLHDHCKPSSPSPAAIISLACTCTSPNAKDHLKGGAGLYPCKKTGIRTMMMTNILGYAQDPNSDHRKDPITTKEILDDVDDSNSESWVTNSAFYTSVAGLAAGYYKVLALPHLHQATTSTSALEIPLGTNFGISTPLILQFCAIFTALIATNDLLLSPFFDKVLSQDDLSKARRVMTEESAQDDIIGGFGGILAKEIVIATSEELFFRGSVQGLLQAGLGYLALVGSTTTGGSETMAKAMIDTHYLLDTF